jgi:hypothetical protein
MFAPGGASPAPTKALMIAKAERKNAGRTPALPGAGWGYAAAGAAFALVEFAVGGFE